MITWIPVCQRVPADRREVFVWGLRGLCWAGVESGWENPPGVFGGLSRCNVHPYGHTFDIEVRSFWSRFTGRRFLVTHWAEVSGPDGKIIHVGPCS